MNIDAEGSLGPGSVGKIGLKGKEAETRTSRPEAGDFETGAVRYLNHFLRLWPHTMHFCQVKAPILKQRDFRDEWCNMLHLAS